MPSFSLHSFGCRANQADGAELAAQLEQAGLSRTQRDGDAAWIVVNTCTVTAKADADARRCIRRLHRQHPDARIAVTGCYAQRAPAELRALAGVATVLGHADKWSLPRHMGASAPLVQILPGGRRETAPPLAAALPAALDDADPGDKTRPMLKVQEGCDRRCSFCVVPQVRGAGRSLPLGVILERIQRLAAAGVQEVVVSGINLGQWGQDRGRDLRLVDLVRAVLEQTSLPRLRLSSVEPTDWSPELTELMASAPRLARHAHLPLQSGSDAVLRRMHRRYTAAAYAARVHELARQVPAAAIGADVMVGFPGESAEEFESTRALLAALPLAYLHVFRFSPRDGTEAALTLAAGRWQPVPESVAAARADELRRLSAGMQAAFLRRQLGLRLNVISLAGRHARGSWAISDNYARIALPMTLAPNRMLPVEITGARPSHLEATEVAA